MKLTHAMTLGGAVLMLIASPRVASAHDGRRLEVLVVDDQLVTQGYNSETDTQGDFVDDGAGVVREYTNAIHGHWDNLTSSIALATLPGFDVYDDASSFVTNNSAFTGGGSAEELAGATLRLELLSASKWVVAAPSDIPTAGDFVALGAGDPVVTIESLKTGQSTTSATLGSFDLVTNLGANNGTDLDLRYTIDTNPAGEIYAFEWRLSAIGASTAIAASESIYTLLSPDGSSPAERLHHASLRAEALLGIQAVPEPASVLLAVVSAFGLGILPGRRRRAA